MDSMLQEYQEQLKRTKQLKKEIPNKTLDDKDLHRIITGIITDLEIAVKWLESGVPYGHRKGVYGKSSLDIIDYNRSFKVPTPKAIDPFEKVENYLDAQLEKGKKYGLNSKETFASMRLAKVKKKA